MTEEEKILDQMFEESEYLVCQCREIPAYNEKNEISDEHREYIPLQRIIFSKRRLIRDGKFNNLLGLSRFVGEWNFEEEIVQAA